MVIPFGLLAACAGGAVDAPRPREPLPIPPPTATSATAIDRSSPTSVVLLVSANGENKCVELLRSPATDVTSKVTLATGSACRPATLTLSLEKKDDAELLRSVQLRRVTAAYLPGERGRPGEIAETCTVVDPTLRPYPSLEVCETARAGAPSLSVGDSCVQRTVDRAFAPDQTEPRLARLDEAALMRAMKENGNLFVITGKARQCATWTFEHGSTDAFHGSLVRRFTRKQGKEDVRLRRSYAYDPACKAFGFFDYFATMSVVRGGRPGDVVGGGQQRAQVDACKVTGLLERANDDAIDVGDRTLFLTEAACKAAARAPAARSVKGAASPYVADDEDC
ncbi:MAG: hypothetical protein HOO96_25520 [Polyangiaceae bacterium]|nr:hypothetical protein [Polyangiaceae bacterium]